MLIFAISVFCYDDNFMTGKMKASLMAPGMPPVFKYIDNVAINTSNYGFLVQEMPFPQV